MDGEYSRHGRTCYKFLVRIPGQVRVPGALSLGVKRPEREADHSPSSVEVKE